MIIDTDVVTSTSVQTSYDSYYPNHPSKRARSETILPSARGDETLSNLPTHLVGQQGSDF